MQAIKKEYNKIMKTKKTLTIRLAEDQLKTLREIALKEDRSLSNVIRRFISDGIKKEKTDTGRKKNQK